MNQTKTISMELTGEGARVTSLRLEGSRLVLTIEAQLADSQLIATDPAGAAPAPISSPASAPAPEPVFTPAPVFEPEPEPENVPFETAPQSGVITLTDESLSFAAQSVPQFAQEPEADDQPNIWGDLSVMSVEEPDVLAQEQPLAMSEESSTLGGARHGEPQPAISFGQEIPPPPPVFTPEPAPAPVPEPAPIPLPPMPEPEPEPVPQPFLQTPQTPPAPEPEPAGGTTVLIRYTCPKCKTQGMQAVDKVGTVVNCSNCGKAMRLVMKK